MVRLGLRGRSFKPAPFHGPCGPKGEVMDSKETAIQEQTANIRSAVEALVSTHTGRPCHARVLLENGASAWTADAHFAHTDWRDGHGVWTPFAGVFRSPPIPRGLTPEAGPLGALDDLRRRVRLGLEEAMRRNQLGFVTLARAEATLGGYSSRLAGVSGDPTASWPDVRVDATFGHVELKGCSGGLESIRLSAVGEVTSTARLTPSEARTLARVLMLYAATHQDNKVDGDDSPSGEEGDG